MRNCWGEGVAKALRTVAPPILVRGWAAAPLFAPGLAPLVVGNEKIDKT